MKWFLRILNDWAENTLVVLAVRTTVYSGSYSTFVLRSHKIIEWAEDWTKGLLFIWIFLAYEICYFWLRLYIHTHTQSKERAGFTFASGSIPEYYLKLLNSLYLRFSMDISFPCLWDLIRVIESIYFHQKDFRDSHQISCSTLKAVFNSCGFLCIWVPFRVFF